MAAQKRFSRGSSNWTHRRHS